MVPSKLPLLLLVLYDSLTSLKILVFFNLIGPVGVKKVSLTFRIKFSTTRMLNLLSLQPRLESA